MRYRVILHRHDEPPAWYWADDHPDLPPWPHLVHFVFALYVAVEET